MAISEDEALGILFEEMPASGRRVALGIGDDAALLDKSREEIVCTVDSCEQGAHFLWEWVSAEDVAHKSLHSAVSDVCAMGGTPRFIVCHITLGSRVTSAWLRRFFRQQMVCARQVGASIVGGNVSSGDEIRVITTVLGEVPRASALTRSGARGGDEVWLIGELGLARAGLELLKKRATRARGEGARATCLRAFRRPDALVKPGVALRRRAHSCLDVSDGLARDATQLAHASAVRVVIEEDALRSALHPDLTRVAKSLGQSPLVLAAQGGEDYALLATGPSHARPRAARVIGRIEKLKGASNPGAMLERADEATPLIGGFVHGGR